MAPTTTHQAKPGYQPRDYSRLVGTRGFSEELLRTHFELYEGYVTHTNKALGLLRGATLEAYAAGEVRRRFAWEFNGMRLHELFFDGMVSGGHAIASDSPLRAALAGEWGSFEAWQEHFDGISQVRGIGWAALVHDPVGDRLLNTWVNEHDAGALAGTHPILLLDLFEHAYMRDYGMEKGAYVQAFRQAVDWSVCERRWRASRRPPASLAGA